MFEHLAKQIKSLKAAQRPGQESVKNTLDDIRQITRTLTRASRLMRAHLAIRQLVSGMESTAVDYKILRQLKGIAAEGLHPQIMKLVDGKKTGDARLFRRFPAVEKMDGTLIPSTDRRLRKSLEDIEENLDMEPAIVQTFIENAGADVKELFESCDEQLETIEETHESLKEALEAGDVTNELLTKVVVHCCSAESLFKIFSLLKDALKLLSDKEGEAEHEEGELQKICDMLDEFTGLYMDEDNGVQADPEDIEEMHEPSQKSLADHGYTPDKIHELLDEVEELAEELEKLCKRHQEVGSYFKEHAEDMLEEKQEAEENDHEADGTDPAPATEDTVSPDESDPGVDTTGTGGDQGDGEMEEDPVADARIHITSCCTVMNHAIEEAMQAISMAFMIIEQIIIAMAAPMSPENTPTATDNPGDDGLED